MATNIAVTLFYEYFAWKMGKWEINDMEDPVRFIMKDYDLAM